MKKTNSKIILVTGAAGFIGYHLCSYFLKKGMNIIGIDNLNSYYSKKLKEDRIKELFKQSKNFKFFKIDIRNKNQLISIFKKYKFCKVFHMAAQAGVRKSIKYPNSYLSNNILGTTNLFEVVKDFEKMPVFLASSSSVYGIQSKNIYSTKLRTDSPIQMYAVSKKCTELMGYSYNFQYNIPVIALRFFTVYGPWGRPDMALFNFTKKISERKPINVYNNGNHYRDFTYIDDIIIRISLISNKIKANKFNKNKFEVYNIGNGEPCKLLNFIKLIEEELKIKSKIKFLSNQQGDMKGTHADMSKFNYDFKKIKNYPLKQGIKKFVKWFKEYYKINEQR